MSLVVVDGDAVRADVDAAVVEEELDVAADPRVGAGVRQHHAARGGVRDGEAATALQGGEQKR